MKDVMEIKFLINHLLSLERDRYFGDRINAIKFDETDSTTFVSTTINVYKHGQIIGKKK